ncbi:MAG: DUF2085 domain-containing protein [Balneolaceae bacterium]|nr:DUF2085 domain-containing protein [Balneolaceae bacterium]MDR9446580.1 DUF2085 domain-containing protein [Balneolaceae bacterium]
MMQRASLAQLNPKNQRLAPVLAASFFTLLWIFTLGPGVYLSEPPTLGHWHYIAFSAVCHALADRTYLYDGIQMAVNSRCFGIFSGLMWGAWLHALIPLFAVWLETIWPKRLAWVALGWFGVQVIDVAGNQIGWWVNTLDSRAILGFGFGLFLVYSIQEAFQISNKHNIKSHLTHV